MNVPADFVLVSGGEEVPASFYMMAVWCNTLRSLGVHHPTFEVPSVDRRALETFRDCVYLLSFDKAQGHHPEMGGGLARSRIGQTIQRIYLAERRRSVYAKTD